MRLDHRIPGTVEARLPYVFSDKWICSERNICDWWRDLDKFTADVQ